MKNIKDYNLDNLKDELISIGEKSLELSRFLNGYIKKMYLVLMK